MTIEECHPGLEVESAECPEALEIQMDSVQNPESWECDVKDILSSKPKKYQRSICVHELMDDSAECVDGLYPFQSHLRALLSNLQVAPCNILVASPTGSGKTFAIEEAERRAVELGKPIFVAQPLIALAEQVYARLNGERSDHICLRTGPSCSGQSDDTLVTVCTYEVLSRACLRNPHLLDSALLVIIDEIHYIASDRGPAILEIIHSCCNVPLVALSGTLPNQKKFAEFMASVNDLPTFITGAKKRPIPVTYHTYDTNSCTCHTLKSTWQVHPRIDSDALGGIKGKQDLLACIRCMQNWDSLPLLVVMFSCRKLDQFAEWASCQDHLNAGEKSRVTILFKSMMRSIPEEDAVLFGLLRSQALRGIGSHHSHLPVPYLELVCRLAEERLVKIVFSSSTLSAGINLPVRTVLICGARMPQRDATGKMSFDLLTPLLFNQLAGRAGRPGLESRGFCVIATKGQTGYESAQGLFMRRLQPVMPYDGLTEGDVLRARRYGRKLGLERTVFANPEAKALIVYANELTDRLRMLNSKQGAVVSANAKELADAIISIEGHPAAVPFARKSSDRVLCLWKTCEGRYRVTPREDALNSAIDITALASKRNQRIPLQIFADAQVVRIALDTVAGASPRLLALASADIYVRNNRRACFLSPLASEESAIIAAIPETYISQEDEILTPLGYAACNIRTSTLPCVLMEVLLSSSSDWTAETLAGVLSLALGEGRTDVENEEKNDESAEHQTLLCIIRSNQKLKEFACLTQKSLAVGVLLWVHGETLEEICMVRSLCSVGSLCRHIVRVHDLAEEVAQACEELSVAHLLLLCRELQAHLCRGLPFLKRGSGRVS